MPYTAEISRTNPTYFIFILDQSGSMLDSFGGEVGEKGLRKADFLADVVNRTLHDLVMRCTKPEEVRNYYHISIIGYGNGVGPAFGGALAGREIVPIAEVADNPVRVETRMKKTSDGAGGLVDQAVKFPIWVDSQGSGGTPMCAALKQAEELIKGWISDPSHKTSFPPTILHITDGESTDGDPTDLGRTLTSLGVSDGQALLYNCHISSERAAKIEYPSNVEEISNQFAKVLFNFSSILPTNFNSVAKQIGLPVKENSRGFVFNADSTALVQFFDIGTRSANLR